MKKKLFTAVVFVLLGSFLWGQSLSDQEILRRLNLNQAQLERITELNREYELVKREATIEQNFYKAQLERLLLQPDPDMSEIEETLRNSMEWKLKDTMADVERRIEIRKAIGEDKWIHLLRLISEKRQRDAEAQR